MNYREIIRKAVSSPWDGTSTTYGQWGALRPEQRKLILRLLDEMDSADEYIKHLFFENEDLKNKNKKLVSIIKTLEKEFDLIPSEYVKELEKGGSNE